MHLVFLKSLAAVSALAIGAALSPGATSTGKAAGPAPSRYGHALASDDLELVGQLVRSVIGRQPDRKATWQAGVRSDAAGLAIVADALAPALAPDRTLAQIAAWRGTSVAAIASGLSARLHGEFARAVHNGALSRRAGDELLDELKSVLGGLGQARSGG